MPSPGVEVTDLNNDLLPIHTYYKVVVPGWHTPIKFKFTEIKIILNP